MLKILDLRFIKNCFDKSSNPTRSNHWIEGSKRCSKKSGDDCRRAGRGGLGVKALKVTEAKGDLIDAGPVDEDTEVMLMSTGGTAIRCAVKQIKQMSRAAQGVRVMKLSSEEEVSAFIPIKN